MQTTELVMGRVSEIERNIQDLIGSEVTLLPYGINSYRVITPFLFDDGDNLSIVLKNQNEKWLLTDEGHTLMHLSYDIDDRELRKGTRAKIINNVLKRFGVEDQNGSFVLQIESDGFGPYILDYIQALLHVTDISFLNRKLVINNKETK